MPPQSCPAAHLQRRLVHACAELPSDPAHCHALAARRCGYVQAGVVIKHPSQRFKDRSCNVQRTNCVGL